MTTSRWQLVTEFHLYNNYKNVIALL